MTKSNKKKAWLAGMLSKVSKSGRKALLKTNKPYTGKRGASKGYKVR